MTKYRRYHRTPKGRFRSGKSRAKKRKIPWEITYEQYLTLIEQDTCHYCTNPLSDTGSGLDRKNSDLGYCISNVVPCCGDCNNIKGTQISYKGMIVIGAVLNALKRIL
jgi:hypothetical protein